MGEAILESENHEGASAGGACEGAWEGIYRKVKRKTEEGMSIEKIGEKNLMSS